MRLSLAKDLLLENLRDDEYAKVYVNRAAAESVEEFLHALINVARAQEGGVMSVVAKGKGAITRANLYRALRPEGNPRVRTVDAVLRAMNLHLAVEGIEGSNPDERAMPFGSSSSTADPEDKELTPA